MECPPPRLNPGAAFHRAPEHHTIRRSEAIEEAFSVAIEGVEYVIRAAATSATQINVEVEGGAGRELVATSVAPAGDIIRIHPPAVLAGDTLVVRVKGKKGTVIRWDLGWRAP